MTIDLFIVDSPNNEAECVEVVASAKASQILHLVGGMLSTIKDPPVFVFIIESDRNDCLPLSFRTSTRTRIKGCLLMNLKIMYRTTCIDVVKTQTECSPSLISITTPNWTWKVNDIFFSYHARSLQNFRGLISLFLGTSFLCILTFLDWRPSNQQSKDLLQPRNTDINFIIRMPIGDKQAWR